MILNGVNIYSFSRYIRSIRLMTKFKYIFFKPTSSSASIMHALLSRPLHVTQTIPSPIPKPLQWIHSVNNSAMKPLRLFYVDLAWVISPDPNNLESISIADRWRVSERSAVDALNEYQIILSKSDVWLVVAGSHRMELQNDCIMCFSSVRSAVVCARVRPNNKWTQCVTKAPKWDVYSNHSK